MSKVSNIEVSAEAHARIRLLQAAWHATEAAVIDRLLDAFAQPQPASADQLRDQNELEVRASYEGHFIKGTFDKRTHSLRIDEGPLAGQSFKSPSGAAMAIVRQVKPDVHSNRNGWTFWTVTDTGYPLQSVRPGTPRRTT